MLKNMPHVRGNVSMDLFSEQGELQFEHSHNCVKERNDDYHDTNAAIKHGNAL